MNWMKCIEIDFHHHRFDSTHDFCESIYDDLDEYRESDISILSTMIDIKLLYKVIYSSNR